MHPETLNNMHKCPYCKSTIMGNDWERHFNSLSCKIEKEIQNDPILRFNLREASLEYNKLLHQVDVQIASFKIALYRALNEIR